MINYNFYKLDKKECFKVYLLLYIVFCFIAFIFYQNIFISLILGFTGFLYVNTYKKSQIKKRKEILLGQFKDMLYSLNVALETGDVVTNAFKTTYCELLNIYGDSDYIIVELKNILKFSDLNNKIEDLLIDFAKRTDIEDIINFAEVFYICIKSGGNISKVLKQASEIITEKMELEQEIKTLFSQKELEVKILMITPILIFLTLSIVARQYIEPLHSTFFGYVIITISISIIILASFISEKMTNIEV